MPQIDWTPEHKRTSTVEFDRLKLKVGERARIVTLEKPTFTWVHTLRAPKIVNGEANKVIKKRADGTEFADWDMDFVGRPQCLGDLSTIADEGIDAKNCPVCARAKDSEETQAPDRRFAMNVIKYNTRADGTPVEPFGCSSLVWTFTEGIFNKLYGIAQEYGGLVGRDLVLGPCQAPEAFQKFDITAGARNLWEMTDAIKKTVTDTHENQRIEDLEGACGRKVEAKWLRRDIESIQTRWQIANGVAAPVVSERQEVASLKGELDNLLGGAPAASTPQGLTPAEPKPTDEGQGQPSDGETDSFSKLLANLNI